MNPLIKTPDDDVKCSFCGYYHKRKTLYMEDSVRLIKMKDTFLIECKIFGIKYLSYNDKELCA